MPVRRLPINLTAAALERGGQPGAAAASSILQRPELRCDRLDGPALQAEGPAAVAWSELYVVAAGYGAMRCADGSVLNLTAGDVAYVPAGTDRGFSALSRKFSVLRLKFFADASGFDPG